MKKYPKGTVLNYNYSKLIRLLIGQIYIDVTNSVNDTTVVLGSGRSGTTWIAETINYKNNFRYIFEPFNPQKIFPELNAPDIGFIGNGFSPNENIMPYIDRVLKGRCRGFRIDRYNKKIFPKRRIVKEVRANLYIDWIANKYSTISFLYLIRNPYLVCWSQKKGLINFGSWYPCLEFIASNELLLNFLPKNIREHIVKHEELTLYCQIFLRWIVENYIGINSIANSNSRVVVHDGIFYDKKNILKEIFSFINIEWSDRVIKLSNKPSAMSRKNEDHLKQKNYLENIKKSLSKSEIKITNWLLENSGFSAFIDDRYLSKKYIYDHPKELLVK